MLHVVPTPAGPAPGPAPGPDAAARCENCDHREDLLVAVRRVYLAPEAWDTPGREVVLDTVERWCLSCATLYPCRPPSD